MYGSAVLGLGLGLGLRNRQILLDEDENETVRRSGVSRGWERFRLDTLLGLHYKRLQYNSNNARAELQMSRGVPRRVFYCVWEEKLWCVPPICSVCHVYVYDFSV